MKKNLYIEDLYRNCLQLGHLWMAKKLSARNEKEKAFAEGVIYGMGKIEVEIVRARNRIRKERSE